MNFHSIRSKVLATFALLILLLAMQTVFLITQSTKVHEAADTIVLRHQPVMSKAYEFQIAVVQVQQWLTDISATRGLDGLNDGFDEAAASYQTAETLLADMALLDPHNAASYMEIKPALEAYYSVGKSMAQAYVDLGPRGGNQRMADFDAAAEALTLKVGGLMASSKDRLQMQLTQQTDAALLMKYTTLVLSVLFLVILLSLMLLALRTLLAPINAMKRMARDLAEGEGDLTKRLDDSRSDELGSAAAWINKFVSKTQQTIQAIRGVTMEMRSAAEHLAGLAEQTDKEMSSQLMESQQAATAMNEMLASAQETANNASETARGTEIVNNESRSGKSNMETTAFQIGTLAKEMDKAQRVIEKLGVESANIGSVLDVIKNISEQTNLLALNAAIEAARAGEQGRGFAVVADEVRTLASRTQQSTAEIQEMINRLQSSSSDAVSVIDAGGKLAHTSVSSIQQANDSLEVITRRVESISQMNTQIATAAEEQSQVSLEIDRNITNIAQVAENNAHSVAMLSSTSEQLKASVQQLDQLMGQFKT